MVVTKFYTFKKNVFYYIVFYCIYIILFTEKPVCNSYVPPPLVIKSKRQLEIKLIRITQRKTKKAKYKGREACQIGSNQNEKVGNPSI